MNWLRLQEVPGYAILTKVVITQFFSFVSDFLDFNEIRRSINCLRFDVDCLVSSISAIVEIIDVGSLTKIPLKVLWR